MSRPIYKDDKSVSNDVKAIRLISDQYHNIRDHKTEIEATLSLSFVNGQNCPHATERDPCRPMHSAECTKWAHREGNPIRNIVVLPIPARLSNSFIVEVPANKQSEFKKCLWDLSLMGRVNTWPMTRQDTSFVIHFPDTT